MNRDAAVHSELLCNEVHRKGFKTLDSVIFMHTNLSKVSFYHHFPKKTIMGYALLNVIDESSRIGAAMSQTLCGTY